MHDLLAKLNDRQQEAVTAPQGPVLVLAGAGSGKTRVLTYRIAYLLQKKQFAARELLALTFTNKAAGEMRERIEKLLGKKELGLTMGTFHAVCARFLRQDIQKLGRGYDRNFVIYDTEDSGRLLKQITMELGLAERFRPQIFAYYISRAKNRLTTPRQLSLESEFLAESLQEVFEIYEERLRAHNALDFDDLLALTCELFQKVPAVLKKYQDRYQYVLVDEYQDTNHAQYWFLRLLVKKHHNLFVVGDDAQSIYGFRGANLQNILDFKKDYPQARVILLEQNYRSTQNILDAATKVIRLNASPYEKTLWTENQAGDKLQLYEAADEADESQFILRSVIGQGGGPAAEPVYESEDTPILNRFFRQPRNQPQLLYLPGREVLDLRQTAILYRTHAQSRPFEELFLAAGLPYQIVGGIKFYERREIKDVLAYLRLVLNPRDLVALSRVINLPARGIGTANLRAITAALPAHDYNYARLKRNLESLALQPKAISGAQDFFAVMQAAGSLPKARNVLDLLRLLLLRSGYKDSLLDGTREGETRWENIEELFNVAARYKKLPWDEGGRGLLEEAALMTDLDTMEQEGNQLTMMTLHSAKGLEYDNVFFVGLEEGILPHSRSLSSAQELSEEIRLAYVGMTRARRNLFLSYARQRQTYGELKRAVPSRILKAIPKKLIEKFSATNI